MIYDLDIAKQIAKFLLQINAIILQPEKPFKWASGWNSPIYCDNRKILSYPEIRNHIRQSLASAIKNHFNKADVIAGVATAGIPHGVLVAEELGLPFIYVRNDYKGHGRKNKIEGNYEEGQSVILIEDLISSGKSSIDAANSLKNEGMIVKGVISIFSYGLQTAIDNFNKNEIDIISLCNYDTLLPEALEKNFINSNDLETLKDWKKNPEKWKISHD
tara:strand:+ start:279 stop:929 length:651 start_codon:yes stop_codon:yes gene_type:complete